MTEVEDLRAQLKGALKSRAMVYSAVYDELSAEFGEAKAEEILKRAIYKRGAVRSRRPGKTPSSRPRASRRCAASPVSWTTAPSSKPASSCCPTPGNPVRKVAASCTFAARPDIVPPHSGTAFVLSKETP